MNRLLSTIFALIISALFLSADTKFDSLYAHSVEGKEQLSLGENIYIKFCSMCHHSDRIGTSGPPLFPSFLKKLSDERIKSILVDGLPQTLMPTYSFLTKEELDELVKFLRSPVKKYSWDIRDISSSITKFDDPIMPLKIDNLEDVTPVVERDGGKVWIMEDEKILSKFDMKNVHGGIKYTMDGKNIYIPTRDGWIERYQLDQGRRFGKVRPCINLRNTSLSRDGKFLFATCLLPEAMVVMDSQTLKPLQFTSLNGKVSALYEFYSKDEAIFTFRDKPKLAIVNTKTFQITYKDLKDPIEDFFIDPFEKFLIGTSRRGKELSIYDLETDKYVFNHKMEGMPHLFSATYWYQNGSFYFATPHIGKAYITIWQMYDWKFVRQVDTGGVGFFVKTHPNTPYLWSDNGSDELLLINKENFSIKKIVPRKNKQYIHTEFSGDGKYAYLSIYERDGEIIVLDTTSTKEIIAYPANVPVGKYNYINKNRQFYPRLFGVEIFKEKCWGCHHQSAEAFGPAFNKIAKTRDDGQIMAHILDPKSSYKDLGYNRNLMPPFKLNEYQLKSIVDFIKSTNNN